MQHVYRRRERNQKAAGWPTPMGNMPSGASRKRIYEDFDPFCDWHREEEHDILNVHLEGFRRHQLKVETKKGSLVMSGERPIDPSMWKRFCKEVKVEKDWKVNEISSQFLTGGVLSIKIPKRQTLRRRLGNSFSKIQKSLSRLKPDYITLAAIKGGVLVLVLLMLLVAFGAYVKQKYKLPFSHQADN